MKPHVNTKPQALRPGSRKPSAVAEPVSHYDFDSLTQADAKHAPVNPTMDSLLSWSDQSRRQSKSSPPITDQGLPRKLSAPVNFYHSSVDSTWGPPTVSTTNTSPSTLKDAGHTGKFKLSTSSHKKSSASLQDLTNTGTYGTQRSWNISQPWPLDQHQLDAMGEDNDAFDVSDEDIEMGETSEPGVWQEAVHDDHLKNNDLGIVVALQANQDNHGVSLRSFTSFIDRPDMLATYVPSSQSTPLRDPMTARIFCHFVNVTAPCISMFERHPANPSLIFQGEPVPKTQQHIWTCKRKRKPNEVCMY